MKTIWLHVGASKTGTSALQVALARLRSKLAEAGLGYPESMSPQTERRAQEGKVTGGNAVELGALVSPSLRPAYSVDRPAALAWANRVIEEATQEVILFSSEALQCPEVESGRALAALLTSGGRSLNVVFFVRHALDYCIASFAQRLKVGITIQNGVSDLESYIARWIVPFPSQFEAWAAIAGEASVHCRLYEEDRSELLIRLLETVHPSAAGVIKAEPASKEKCLVNRSPTASEMRLLHRLTEEPDRSSLCYWLSEGAMNGPPSVPEPIFVSQAAFDVFRENNEELVNAFNERWLLPSGREPMRLTSDQVQIGSPQSRPVEETFARCFISTVRRMSQEHRALRTEVNRLKNLLKQAK